MAAQWRGQEMQRVNVRQPLGIRVTLGERWLGVCCHRQTCMLVRCVIASWRAEAYR
jgi:hypothetical protein